MPHEYRPPRYRSSGKNKSGDRNSNGKSVRKNTARKKQKSLGLETTRHDNARSKIIKNLSWCPNCNCPLIAKTCLCRTESVKIPLQQPYDVRPALKHDRDLIVSLIKKRFGEKVTVPNIIVLNKTGGLDRNDLVIADGVRFAWLSFNPITRKYSLDIEAEALPFIIGRADKGIVDIEKSALSIPEGRLGGKKLEIKRQNISDGVVIVKYKSKYGTGILKGGSLKIKELKSIEPINSLPNPEWKDAVEKNAFHLKNLERTAVREIRQNLTLKPNINCSFSGGKDSTAVWAIAQRAGVKKAFFIDTGLEFPETVEFVKSQNVEFIDKAGDFFNAADKFGIPKKDSRWCCRYLKLEPAAKYVDSFGECLTVQGSRWYESYNRASLEAVTSNPYNPNQLNLSPIRSWKALDVFMYLWWRGIDTNPLYEMGYERVGCYLCPAMLESEFENLKRTHPKLSETWLSYLSKWAAENNMSQDCVNFGLWRWDTLPPKIIEAAQSSGLKL